MATKYLGPSTNLVYKDKVYHPGDDVPMHTEEIAAMVRNGHRFEGVGNDPALLEGTLGATENTPFVFGPFDDRGQMQPLPVAHAPAAPKIDKA